MHSTDDSNDSPLHGLTRERLLTLSDGIFAIALTLLVLELKIPTGDVDVAATLAGQSSAILSMCLTYAVVGLNWLGYHRLMAHLRTVDAVIGRINLCFLFLISVQPFPTAILGRVSSDPLAVILYASVMVATGLCLLTMWLYALNKQFVRADVSAAMKRYLTLRYLVVPIIFGLSIPIALWQTDRALYSWIGVAVAFAILRRLRPVQTHQ